MRQLLRLPVQLGRIFCSARRAVRLVRAAMLFHGLHLARPQGRLESLDNDERGE